MKARPAISHIAALLLAALLLLSALSCGSSGVSRQAKPAGGTFKAEGKGYRLESNGWTYLHLEGGSYELGYQSGKLMAGDMKACRRTIEKYYMEEMGVEWSHFSLAAAELFTDKLGPELTEEIKGISEGAKAAGVDFPVADVLALNGIIELAGNWWPNVQSGKLQDVERPTRCSAFVATGEYTSDGRVVMAHNTWGAYPDTQKTNLLVDLVPATGHRVFMQSAPGLVHSMTDFFVTGAKIMGTETTISGMEGFDPDGTPEFVRARRAMQYAGSLDEFVALLKENNNGAYANSWLLADARTGEIMRFELGLEQLMEQYKGKLDVAGARAVISDHFDVYLEEDKPGNRTVEGRGDMDRKEYTRGSPFYPAGAVDGKAMDSAQALTLSFEARWGSSGGLAFDVDQFMAEHPQYAYLKECLENRPVRPWTLFRAGMK